MRLFGSMRVVVIVGCAAALVMAFAAPAGADRGVERDPNDARGPLDIARIVHKHSPNDEDAFIHKIVMQTAWDEAILEDGVRLERNIWVTFDVRQRVGSECVSCITEREVLIDVVNGRLRATLLNHLGDPPKKLARLPVWRPDRRTVAFAVTRSQLRKSDYSFYEWGAMSIYQRRGHDHCTGRDACFDRVPRRNRLIRHQL